MAIQPLTGLVRIRAICLCSIKYLATAKDTQKRSARPVGLECMVRVGNHSRGGKLEKIQIRQIYKAIGLWGKLFNLAAIKKNIF